MSGSTPWAPARSDSPGRVALVLACLAVVLVVGVGWPVVAGLDPVQRVVLGSRWVAAVTYAVAASLVLGAALVASLLSRVPLAGFALATLGAALLTLVGLLVFLVSAGFGLGPGDVLGVVLDAVIASLLTGACFLALDLARPRLPALTPGLGALVGAAVALAVSVLTLLYVVLTNSGLRLEALGYDLAQDAVKVALLAATGAGCGAVALARRTTGAPSDQPGQPGRWGSGPGPSDPSAPGPPAS